MRKHWSLLSFVIYIVILVLGILLGKLVSVWPLLDLKYEVDIIGALSTLSSIIITLLVAYWVANFLEKSKETNRAEKDLFIRRIEDLSLLIEELSEKVSSQSLEFIEAASTLKRISIKYHSVFSCLTETEITIDGAYETEAKETIALIKDLLTNTPVLNEDNVNEIPIEIRDGIIRITNERKIQIEASFDKLKTNIFVTELAINKS